MARRLLVRSFDPRKPVVVRKSFRAAGRPFVPGDKFDWRSLSVAERRVRQMYDVGLIWHGDEQPEPTTVRVKRMQERATPTQERAAPVTPTPTGETPENWPRHVGGPYFQLSDGTRVKGREDAQIMQLMLDDAS